MTDVFAEVEQGLALDRNTRLSVKVSENFPGIIVQGVESQRPNDSDEGQAVIGDVTPVDLRGNAPLEHYSRASLEGSATLHITAGAGFFYALVFPGGRAKTNGMTIGIGTSSSYDLNRQHQPIDVIHYNEVMGVAAQIATSGYYLADGPLTQRFFGDERAYKQHIAATDGYRGAGRGTFDKTNIECVSRSLAHVMQTMHREVWGDPLAYASIIELPHAHTGFEMPYNLVVRYDNFLDRVVIGVTPKESMWGARGANGLRRIDPQRAARAEGWEFRELLRITKRQIVPTIARWRENGVIALPYVSGSGVVPAQVGGSALGAIINGVEVAAMLAGWPID